MSDGYGWTQELVWSQGSAPSWPARHYSIEKARPGWYAVGRYDYKYTCLGASLKEHCRVWRPTKRSARKAATSMRLPFRSIV